MVALAHTIFIVFSVCWQVGNCPNLLSKHLLLLQRRKTAYSKKKKKTESSWNTYIARICTFGIYNKIKMIQFYKTSKTNQNGTSTKMCYEEFTCFLMLIWSGDCLFGIIEFI